MVRRRRGPGRAGADAGAEVAGGALVQLTLAAVTGTYYAAGPDGGSCQLTLKTDGNFVLDYKGEIVLQTPPDAEAKSEPWSKEKARCRESGRIELDPFLGTVGEDDEDKVRPCSSEQLAEAK